MSKFNGYFTSISSRISGERPVLTYNSDSNDFPLGITELEGTSTGTRKSVIAAYDLAYQQFARSEKKRCLISLCMMYWKILKETIFTH